MSESLYPHEVIIDNSYRIISTILFIYTGMSLIISIYSKSPFDIIVACVFFVFGCIYNGFDYKYRGLD